MNDAIAFLNAHPWWVVYGVSGIACGFILAEFCAWRARSEVHRVMRGYVIVRTVMPPRGAKGRFVKVRR